MLKRIWSRQSEPPVPPVPPDTPTSIHTSTAVEPVSSETTPTVETGPEDEGAPAEEVPAEGEGEDGEEGERDEDKSRGMKRPSKRATAAEMRGELARLGLESKGKRETLYRYVLLLCGASCPRGLPQGLPTEHPYPHEFPLRRTDVHMRFEGKVKQTQEMQEMRRGRYWRGEDGDRAS